MMFTNTRQHYYNNTILQVWRNHDYIHSLTADGVYAGVLDQLEWKQYTTDNHMLSIPGLKLRSLIAHVKEQARTFNS
jgi:hypothetical protein